MATPSQTPDAPATAPASTASSSGRVADDVDGYIAAFPPEAQALMQMVRAVIREAVPGAEEAISYEIPTFKVMGRPALYFAAFKRHVGVYPVPLDHEAFRDDLTPYRSGKAPMRLPLGAPPPLDLLRRIAVFNVQQVLETNGRKR